jgi:hypothetical protein
MDGSNDLGVFLFFVGTGIERDKFQVSPKDYGDRFKIDQIGIFRRIIIVSVISSLKERYPFPSHNIFVDYN